VATLEASPSRLELARSLVDLGETLRVARRRSDAREHLHRAVDLATECGSAVLRARAVEALEALGDRAPAGRANREIAQELFETPKTVEKHLGHVYTKLGIAGRRDLARVLA
jgi:DNA-binding NarL/FixJ family response regulator